MPAIPAKMNKTSAVNAISPWNIATIRKSLFGIVSNNTDKAAPATIAPKQIHLKRLLHRGRVPTDAGDWYGFSLIPAHHIRARKILASSRAKGAQSGRVSPVPYFSAGFDCVGRHSARQLLLPGDFPRESRSGSAS
jgi:hypothetical protein